MNQIYYQQVYIKKNNNLTHDIEIIDSNTKKEEGDIYYNFL